MSLGFVTQQEGKQAGQRLGFLRFVDDCTVSIHVGSLCIMKTEKFAMKLNEAKPPTDSPDTTLRDHESPADPVVIKPRAVHQEQTVSATRSTCLASPRVFHILPLSRLFVLEDSITRPCISSSPSLAVSWSLAAVPMLLRFQSLLLLACLPAHLRHSLTTHR
jgi:hypothetical protein